MTIRDLKPHSFVRDSLVLAVVLSSASCGARSEARRLIIHVEQAGTTDQQNDLVFDALNAGIVTSAASIVIAPSFKDFATRARQFSDADFGLQLALNSPSDSLRFRPSLPAEDVPTLTDDEGFLWSDVDSLVAHANLEEVERELRSQISVAHGADFAVSHLDSYKSALLRRSDFADLYLKLAIELQLPIVVAQPGDSETGENFDTLRSMIRRLNAEVLPNLDTRIDARRFSSSDFPLESTVLAIRRLSPGVSQIDVRLDAGDRLQQDGLPAATVFDALALPAFRDEIRRNGIVLTDWRQFATRVGNPDYHLHVTTKNARMR